MKLAAREKRTILIGAVIAVVVGGYMVVGRLARATPGSGGVADHKRQFFDASAQIKRYGIVGSDLKKQADTLHVEVPTDAPPEQMKQLVEKFESLAGRVNVQIRNITQLKSQTRQTAARGPGPTELKLDLTCPGYAALVRFIDNLEQSSVPIVVDQINITTIGGRGGGGPGPRGRGGPEGGQKRQIQAALKIYTYLFPEKAQQ